MRKIRRLFRNDRDQLRTGWRLLIGAAAGFGTLYGLRLLLGFAFGRLFDAWGLTSDNLAYVPMFARQIVYWHTDFTYILAYAACILVSALVAKNWSKPAANDARLAGIGALAGFGSGALLSTAALLVDSMRLERPLGEISLSPALISGLIVVLLGCICGEMLSKRLIFDPVRQRYGRWVAYAATAIVAIFADLTPMGALNGILMALIGCVFYERGGMLASAALRAGWMIWTNLVFAWPGSGSASMYRMYTVSEIWLTGGNAGAEAGFGCTLLWMIIAVILLRKDVKRLMNRMNKRRILNG